MEQALEIWEKFLVSGVATNKVERVSKWFGSDIAKRNSFGFAWVLKGFKVIDLRCLCPKAVGVFNEKTSKFQLRQYTNKSLEKLKVKEVYYLGEMPKYYLFSGSSGYEPSRLKEHIRSAGLAPYDLGYGIANGILELSNDKIMPYIYFLHLEPSPPLFLYDKRTYNLRCHIQNQIDIASVDTWIWKDKLHEAMKNTSFVAKTVNLDDFEFKPGKYILRPSHALSYAGKDIKFVETQEQLNEAIWFYTTEKMEHLTRTKDINKYYEVIVSEYITNPVLWKQRKSHIRLYGICDSVNRSFKISRFGQIFTSANKFDLSDISDKSVHDTHGKYSPRDIWFPDEFERQDLIPSINAQLSSIEKLLTGLCTPKPYKTAKYAYMLFGVDFMVRTTGEVVLIEINMKPGMADLNPDYPRTIQFHNDLDDWIWSNVKHLFLEEK